MPTTTQQPLPASSRRGGAPRAQGKRRRRVVVLIVSTISMTVGLVLLGGMTLAPETMDRVTGNAKVAIRKQVQQVVAPDALPEVNLGVEGGMRELDRCDNTFTEMVGYRVPDVLPLYAAHNRCGGDVILGWDIGQRVRIKGSDVVYEVVEERHTPKWSHVEVLEGMQGEFMLQTCFYGVPVMRFLSLSPASPQPTQRADHLEGTVR